MKSLPSKVSCSPVIFNTFLLSDPKKVLGKSIRDLFSFFFKFINQILKTYLPSISMFYFRNPDKLLKFSLPKRTFKATGIRTYQ